LKLFKAHLLIFTTIILAVYIQLITKWQMAKIDNAAPDFVYKVIGQLWNPWIISALGAAFIAALSWMAAMTRLELSYAYPFMSLSFILVSILSNILFQEPITPNKIFGLLLITAGIFVSTRV